MGHSGALRILGFLNRERAGTFRDSILPDGGTDLAATRRPGTKKYGFGLNLEQEIAKDVGTFARYGWSDGKTEAWAFTQIDRSVSGGLSLQGRLWRRPGDNIGVAVVQNYLSGDDRSFLAAGGLGFIIGDGRLNYKPESIAEAYYAWHALREWTFTLDYQRVANPDLQSRPGTCLRGEFTGALGAVAQCAQAPIPALRNPLRLRAARPARRPPRRTASAAGRRPGSAPPSGRPR